MTGNQKRPASTPFWMHWRGILTSTLVGTGSCVGAATRLSAAHSLDRRVWMTLVGIYVAQAIPVYLVAAALPPILRSRGVDLSVIGGLGILMLP